MIKRILLTLSSLLLALTVIIASSPSISALSGSQFNAARIIDDAVFFNGDSMNPQQIQHFMNTKMPACDTNGTAPYAGTTRGAYGTSRGYPPPYTCLRDYVISVPSRAADSYCSGSIAGGVKSSAQIIYDVGKACNISPKVILILLQKEQSLVTDSWPWSIQYTKATGMGCPDSPLGTDVDANQNGCYDIYEGFFNQVWYGARQYQVYAKNPGSFNYAAGRLSYVGYHPNGACSGTNIAMANQATAGLYNYTPYQPNAAALNNLYGTGDACSSYGNRNFWRMYIDWFGSPNSDIPFLWQLESQEAYSNAAMTIPFTSRPTVSPGEKIYIRVRARNMGTFPWINTNVKIGSSWPNDRSSVFRDESWLSGARPARLKEASVTSGEVGTFEFTLKAPENEGTYKEYFNILVEGREWLNDPGMFYMINVNNAASPSSTNFLLNTGQQLKLNDYLLSPDRNSTLSMGRDGRLILRRNFRPVWSSPPAGTDARAVMQGDGNFVLYNKSNVAVWNSETAGNPNARIALQTDGNLVAYSSGNSALWATYTTHNPLLLKYVNTSVRNGLIRRGQQLILTDRTLKLVLQSDGNLVLYRNSTPLWATGTDGRFGEYLAVQGDGNLVLYDVNWQPIWWTGTSGFGALFLTLQGDGNLVLYDFKGTPYWHTNTHGR